MNVRDYRIKKKRRQKFGLRFDAKNYTACFLNGVQNACENKDLFNTQYLTTIFECSTHIQGYIRFYGTIWGRNAGMIEGRHRMRFFKPGKVLNAFPAVAEVHNV